MSLSWSRSNISSTGVCVESRFARTAFPHVPRISDTHKACISVKTMAAKQTWQSTRCGSVESEGVHLAPHLGHVVESKRPAASSLHMSHLPTLPHTSAHLGDVLKRKQSDRELSPHKPLLRLAVWVTRVVDEARVVAFPCCVDAFAVADVHKVVVALADLRVWRCGGVHVRVQVWSCTCVEVCMWYVASCRTSQQTAERTSDTQPLHVAGMRKRCRQHCHKQCFNVTNLEALAPVSLRTASC